MKYYIEFQDDDDAEGWGGQPRIEVWKKENSVPRVGDRVFVGRQWRTVMNVHWSSAQKHGKKDKRRFVMIGTTTQNDRYDDVSEEE